MRHTISYTALLLALSVGVAQADQSVTIPGIGNVSIPGSAATDSTVWLLKDEAGKVIPLSVANAYDSTGKPTVAYSAESNYGGAYQNTVGTTSVVLVDAHGNMVPAGSITGYANSAGEAAPTGYSWAAISATDPNVAWQKATYGDVVGPASGYGLSSAPSAGTITGTYAAGDYVLKADGTILKSSNVNATNCPSATPCSYVTPQTIDPKASVGFGGTLQSVSGFPTLDTTKQNLPAFTQSSLGTDGKPANATTTIPGGAVYSNSTGQYQAVGPAGTVVTDGKGNTTTVGSNSISVAGPNGSVVIADPSITVTGGGTQTQIVNGVTTASGIAGSTYGFQATGNGTYVGLGVKGNQTGVQVQNANGLIQIGSNAGAAPGMTIQDASGNTTLINAGSTSINNGSNTAIVTSTGFGVTDGAGNSAGMGASGVLVTNGVSSAAVTANGFGVSNGANTTLIGAAGIATNGSIVATDGANKGVVTATGVGVGNVKGAAGAVVQTSGTPALAVYGPAGATAPQFIANSAGYISTEGNQIHDVATPTLATDAANKGYVDTGITNLSNIMNNKFQHADGGIAAAMALQSPDRTGSQTWAVSLNEGFWNSQYATGLTGIAQLTNLGTWEVAGKGGFAVTSKGDLGGMIGLQIAGGGGYVPLK